MTAVLSFQITDGADWTKISLSFPLNKGKMPWKNVHWQQAKLHIYRSGKIEKKCSKDVYEATTITGRLNSFGHRHILHIALWFRRWWWGVLTEDISCNILSSPSFFSNLVMLNLREKPSQFLGLPRPLWSSSVSVFSFICKTALWAFSPQQRENTICMGELLSWFSGGSYCIYIYNLCTVWHFPKHI